jgi:hypothetical protein
MPSPYCPLGNGVPSPSDMARKKLCSRIYGLNAKAERHRKQAKVGTAIIVAVSAAVPVLLLLSEQWGGYWVGKFAPAVLAAAAAATAGWLQFQRPYEVWSLYRRYGAKLENDLLLYDYGAEPYDQVCGAARERVLAKQLAVSNMDLELQRELLMPQGEPTYDSAHK